MRWFLLELLYCAIVQVMQSWHAVTGLADANLTGTIPASLGQKLPDLQLVSLRDNPGTHLVVFAGVYAFFCVSTCVSHGCSA